MMCTFQKAAEWLQIEKKNEHFRIPRNILHLERMQSLLTYYVMCHVKGITCICILTNRNIV